MFPSDPSQGEFGDQGWHADGEFPPSHPPDSLEHLANVLQHHGAGATARDVALDLLLNQLAEQACLATDAAGAAIALGNDSELICRATTGKNAPDLGARLNPGSGLSGACVQSREMQRCDSSADPRVDAAACRFLGVESALVTPLLKNGELLGILEIFSPRPYAFSDRDVQTLSALSRRIVDTVSPPEPVLEAGPASAAVSQDIAPQHDLIPDGDVPSSDPLPFLQSPATWKVRRRDYSTPLLTVVVMTLSLLLGWMLGHVGWQGARNGRGPATPSTSAGAPTELGENPSSGRSQDETPKSPPAQPAKVAEPAQSKSRASSSTGGLTVYEGGKLVFQMKPAPGQAHSGVEMAAEKEAAGPVPVRRSTAVALANLVERTEPHYPDQARLDHIQGTVVLRARVGKDGSVQQLQALSGDPQLITAAVDAVRQWRFKPYAPKGEPLEFESDIPVSFTLP